MNIRMTCVAAVATLALAGCASTSPGYGSGYGTTSPAPPSGRCYDCGTVVSIQAASRDTGTNIAGPVLGAQLRTLSGVADPFALPPDMSDFDKLARMKPPVIAAMNGHALGGGLELAVTADIRICEVQAKIGLPETGLGMIPGWSGTQRLVKRLGGQVARRLALTGEIVTAETALTLGIVDQVVEKGGALAAAQAMAERIGQRGPVANIVVKQLINAAENEDSAAVMETLASSLVSYTEDVKEGVAAFQEKRTPTYRGE